METNYKIRGLKEISEALKTLPAKMQANIIRGVLKDAARKEVKNKSTETLPYGERKPLKKIIGVTNVQGSKTSIMVGIKKDYWYVRFLEGGTKERQTKKGYNRGQIVARPVVEEAITGKIDDVVEYINNEFGDRVAEHLTRKIKSAVKKNIKLGI